MSLNTETDWNKNKILICKCTLFISAQSASEVTNHDHYYLNQEFQKSSVDCTTYRYTVGVTAPNCHNSSALQKLQQNLLHSLLFAHYKIWKFTFYQDELKKLDMSKEMYAI